MKMKNDGEHINLLPDSGLPIEEEVNRNVDDVFSECKKNIWASWERKHLDKNDSKQIFDALRTILKEQISPLFREAIQVRRNNDNCQ